MERTIKMLMMVILTVIVSTTLGSNGCLWLGDADNGNAQSGSSGAVIGNPYPADGAGITIGEPVATNAILSWSSATGIASYNVYLGISDSVAGYIGNARNSTYRTRLTPPDGLLADTPYHWRVDSLNAAGEVQSVGLRWTFKTKSATYKITNIGEGLGPISGATNIPIEKTTLSWNIEPSIEGITYKVYFGTNNTLSSPIESSYSNTTYEFANDLSYNTIYYWKIATTVGGVSVTSPVWYFRTKTTLEKADYPFPTDGAENIALNSQLSWLSSAGATKYKVYFRESEELVVELFEADYKKTEPKTVFRTRWTPPSGLLQLGGKTYYWRIDALNDTGDSEEGVVWSFSTKPNLPDPVEAIYPKSTDRPDIRNLELKWEQSTTGATSYDVYFSSGGETANPTYRVNTTKTTYYPGVLKYNTIYKWKINPRNATGVQTNTSTWSFTTAEQTPPALPTSITYDPYPPSPTPPATTKYPITTQLSWLSAADAKTFDVYLSDVESNINKPLNEITAYKLNSAPIPKTVYRTRSTPTLTYDKTYFWKVVAKNDSPEPAVGPVWQFQTIPEKPEKVSELTADPRSGTVGWLTDQTLTWGKADRATSYDIYLGTVITITGAHFKKNVPSTGDATYTYIPSPSLVYSRTYYWRIDTRNSAGVNEGSVWNFTTLTPPAQVSAPIPAHPSNNVSKNITLRWTGDGATSYNVYLSDTKAKVEASQALIANTASAEYSPAFLSWNTPYYWRIDAMNVAGVTAGLIWEFTTWLDPDPVELIYPEDIDTDVPLYITLVWTGASRAVSYNVYLYEESEPLIPVLLGNVLSPAVEYQLERLTPETLYYWRVDAVNPAATIEGEPWSFTTKADSPPVLVLEPSGNQEIDENVLLTITLSATDADGDAIISYSVTNKPAGATLTNNVFTWTPGYEQSGEYPDIVFRANAFGGLSAEETITIVVNNVNRPPELILPAESAGISEDSLMRFTLTSTDQDTDDTWTYSMYNAPTEPTLATLDSVTGVFEWTPDFTQAGAYYVTFRVTDNGGLYDEKVFPIMVSNVNRAPTLTSPSNKEVNEGVELNFMLESTDPDTDDTWTYTMIPLLTNATLHPTTGVFNWTPDFTQSGIYNVAFRVTDNWGAYNEKTIEITVNDVFRTPLAPSGLIAIAISTSQINLSWIDNSNNELGFKIERKTGIGGTYAPLVTVGANVTSYNNNTGLSAGTTYYYQVKAYADGESAFCIEAFATTFPSAPTGVAATDGSASDKVIVTWVKSTGATEYQVYRDGVPLGWLGDVATYNDTAATAPTITPGSASASDGTGEVVILTLSGASVNNGATHTYKVVAKNITGESADSATDTGYRGGGTLTYQWQRSAADSDDNYSDISGATTSPYNDTGAPTDGSGRYYKCVLNATGAAQQISIPDRGFRTAGSSSLPGTWSQPDPTPFSSGAANGTEAGAAAVELASTVIPPAWTPMAPVLGPVSYGGALCYVGNFIYGFRGNSDPDLPDESNNDFYRYSISGNSWQTMASPSWSDPIGEGGALVYPGSGDYIYALAANNTRNFWRYSISGNSWSSRTNTPGFVNDGGDLVSTGNDYIYAFQGGANDAPTTLEVEREDYDEEGEPYTYTEEVDFYGSRAFWRYSISGNSWSSMSPVGGQYDFVFSGSALVYPGSGNFIYAFRGLGGEWGDATYDFWRYSISGNSWSLMTAFGRTTVGTTGGYTVGYGAALVSNGGDFIYAFQGSGGSNAFWRYSIVLSGGQTANTWQQMTGVPYNVGPGGSLCSPGSGDFIYAFGVGWLTTNFCRYSISADNPANWSTMANCTWTGGTGGNDTIGKGGALCSAGGYIYAFKGLKGTTATNTFCRYELPSATYPTGRWAQMANAPDTVREGGALCYANGYIYAFRGGPSGGTGNNNIFWRYELPSVSYPTGRWAVMAPALLTYVSGGAALCYPGSGDYIYAVKGGGSGNQFCRYTIDPEGGIGSWTTLTNLPNVVVDPGGSLCYVNGYIYAIRGSGGYGNQFYRYNIGTGNWERMSPDLPFPTRDGAALAYTGGDFIYATQGGGTNVFWRYALVTSGGQTSNTWLQMRITPAGIASGGALCYPGFGNFIYAFPGGSTAFWRYQFTTSASPGVYTSPTIAPPSGTIDQWGILTFNRTVPANTTFTVDVLRASDNVTLATGVTSGQNLSSISAVPIKLRANFATTDPAVTPTLSNWSVTYTYSP